MQTYLVCSISNKYAVIMYRGDQRKIVLEKVEVPPPLFDYRMK